MTNPGKRTLRMEFVRNDNGTFTVENIVSTTFNQFDDAKSFALKSALDASKMGFEISFPKDISEEQ